MFALEKITYLNFEKSEKYIKISILCAKDVQFDIGKLFCLQYSGLAIQLT